MINLIIADIHNKIEIAEKILKDFDHDHVWFLGDYFDNFDDSPEEMVSIAGWVKKKLVNPNVSMLLGNHDYHYWKPNLQKCSGYTERKYSTIRSILSDVDFSKMLTHAWVDGWLLSHAGYSKHYAHPIKGLTPDVTADWDRKMQASHDANRLPEIFWCGQDRFGNNHHSGILWQDWRTVKKVEGVSQIVGHTPAQYWRKHEGDYCLDTGLHCVGIIENGNLEVVYL